MRRLLVTGTIVTGMLNARRLSRVARFGGLPRFCGQRRRRRRSSKSKSNQNQLISFTIGIGINYLGRFLPPLQKVRSFKVVVPPPLFSSVRVRSVVSGRSFLLTCGVVDLSQQFAGGK